MLTVALVILVLQLALHSFLVRLVPLALLGAGLRAVHPIEPLCG
jgi:hypothetical protein